MFETPSGVPRQFETVRSGDAASLIERAALQREPTDIVLTPEQLHRRNFKRAVAAEERFRSSIMLQTPAGVAEAVANADGQTTETLDRIDRLRRIEDHIERESAGVERLRTVFGTSLGGRIEDIEAARGEFVLTTGVQPRRVDALTTVCEGLDGIESRDALAYVNGIQRLEESLREETDGHVSDAGVFDAATAAVRSGGDEAWRAAFPTVDRVTLAGVSALGSPLLDFLAALGSHTDIEIHLLLRAGTGPRISRRLQSRLSGSPESGHESTAIASRSELSLSTPVTEIAAQTRDEEARTAMAVVDGLLDEGVSVSDIVLVARDVDSYERPLRRAARWRGRTLSVWTQLDLKRTLPYRLVATTCRLLAAISEGDIDADTLLDPLRCQFVMPGDGSGRWPLTAHGLHRIERIERSNGTLREWRESAITTERLDRETTQSLVAFLNWCDSQPRQPSISDVVAVLEPLVDAFEERVLPRRYDDEAISDEETARTARAVQRVAGSDDGAHLLRETRAKYREWLDSAYVERSWSAVESIVDAVATTRPGRREHDNARRIDVLDATDTWLRSYPYVVALGLVAEEWPQTPTGALPAGVRAAIVEGATPAARRLGVRGSWTDAREYDHFVDAVGTATEHLVLTRFTESARGENYHRSPLLSDIMTTTLDDGAVNALRSPEAVLPDRLAGTAADGESAGGSGAGTARGKQ